MERRGFLKGAAALFGLGSVAKAAETPPVVGPVIVQKVERREIKFGQIPVWIDEETLMREGGPTGESAAKFLKKD